LEGFRWKQAPVTVGRRSTILVRAIVLPGVTLGEEVTIGSGAVVNRDVPSGMLAGGVPARVIGENARALDDSARDELTLGTLREVADEEQDATAGVRIFRAAAGTAAYG